MSLDSYFFDSHAHLFSSAIPIEEMLSEAKKNSIGGIVTVACDREALHKSLELAKNAKDPTVYVASGVHPHDARLDNELFFQEISSLALKKEIVAIGETGLDYFYLHSEVYSQKESLRRHIELAKMASLPLIIHCREAFSDLFSIFEETDPKNQVQAVLHCFTGSQEEAIKCLKRGWYISFSGILTFPKSENLRLVAKSIPFSQLLIETDTPYLTPHPYRKEKNQPRFVVEVAKTLSQIKEVPLEEVMKTTTNNAKTLFLL